MSRFVDRLKLASQGVAQPMGFGRGRTVASKAGILLVACLSQAAVNNPADLVSGADAGLIEVSGGNLTILLVISAIACYIMGMGLPTVPLYLVLALLVAPALVKIRPCSSWAVSKTG